MSTPATKIIIEEYSPSWAFAFQQLRLVYLSHLAEFITDIEHVGSTAVPGLAAKPIIDIDIIIGNTEYLDQVIGKLQMLGYEHLGDLGITEREAFKQQSAHVPFCDSASTWPKHNLYVCPVDSDSLKNHIAFRNFLRSNPSKVKEYSDLKKKLVLENPDDIDLYVERKTPFITGILRQVGFNEDSISRITQNNRREV